MVITQRINKLFSSIADAQSTANAKEKLSSHKQKSAMHCAPSTSLKVGGKKTHKKKHTDEPRRYIIILNGRIPGSK